MASSNSSVVVPAPDRPQGSPLKGVKHVIAVGSGKGGVGKSTVCVNLAVALSKLGAKVGILDADIYGPSVPMLMGVKDSPYQQESKVIAPVSHNIKVMSMGLLNPGTTVWRGPIASRAVGQFLSEVDWGELDYLLLDLPPGTGDIQLTISQSARLSGAVIVMTPQKLAVDVAKKGLQMFRQVRVPIIGIVENMAQFECPHCHKTSHVFRSGGAELVAKELNVPLLKSLPLDSDVVTGSDDGVPIVISHPDSPSARAYLDLAGRFAAELSTVLSGGRDSRAEVTQFEPNDKVRMAKLNWNDGRQSLVSYRDLRFLCPCANCVDEGTGRRIITKEKVAEDVRPLKVQTVGNYAISIHWSDGHQTGIYSYDYLRRELVDSKA